MKRINLIIVGFFIVFNLYANEDHKKNLLTHQNKMGKIRPDLIISKKLKDLKIKSIYSVKGIDYVILQLVDEIKTKQNELNSDIEGRYIKGDSILGYKIIDINTKTKSLKLYKQFNEEYGYVIYLNNDEILVCDLEKTKKSKKQTKESNKLNKEEVSEYLYKVKKENLNVRDRAEENATILRILKINDQFTIKRKINDWVEIETIYKKISGDVMDVSKQSNWVKFSEETVVKTSKNSM